MTTTRSKRSCPFVETECRGPGRDDEDSDTEDSFRIQLSDNIKRMTVKDAQTLLRERGLCTTGLKTVLQQRLQQAINADAQTLPVTPQRAAPAQVLAIRCA